MQDKSEHIFEKQFVDNSWDKMSGLLNDALPVSESKQKHRGLIIILALLLLTTTFTAIYYAYKFNSIIPNASLTKEKVIYKNIYLNQEAGLQKKDNSKKISITSSKRAINNSATKSDLKNYINQVDSEKTTSAFLVEKELQAAKTEGVNSIATLATPSLILNNRGSIENLAIEPLETVKKTKEKIRYSIGLMSVVSKDFDFTGYGFSSGVEFPIGKRLGIMTGLAINLISRDHYFLPHFPRANVPKPINPADEAAVYYSGLRSLKQVYLPLGVNYKLTKSLAVNSGVKLRYTYNETIENGTPFPPSTRAVPVPFNNYDNAFNNANLGLTAGIMYNVNNNFSILVDSEWGLGSIINRTQIANPSDQIYNLNLVNLTTNFRF